VKEFLKSSEYLMNLCSSVSYFSVDHTVFSVNCSITCVSVTTIVKTYGAHLKASAATVRLRLYDVLALLPPETYEGIYAIFFTAQCTLVQSVVLRSHVICPSVCL